MTDLSAPATAGGRRTGRRPVLPPARSVAIGLLWLLPVLGVGLVLWGLPVERPLGRPGKFTESPVTPTDLRVQRASNSPRMAGDPTDERVVALANQIEGRPPRCGLELSADGGNSWVAAPSIPALPPEAEGCRHPDVVFDRSGRLHLLFTGVAGPGEVSVGAFLASSPDRGTTFAPVRRVAGPLAYGSTLAIDVDAGRWGRLHLAWLQVGSPPSARGFVGTANKVMAARSDDGDRFSAPVEVSTRSARRPAAPALAVARSGGVHIAYYDLGDDTVDYEGRPGPTWAGHWTLLAATSTDGGGRFGSPTVVDGQVRPPFRVASVVTMAPPALAADAGRACVAWTDARHGDADVLLRCRPTGGRWSDAKRVNDDLEGSGHWQYLPQVSLSPSGRIDLAFYDRRSKPRGEVNDVGFAYSYDGLRFSSNEKLNRLGSKAGAGPRSRHTPELVDPGGPLGILAAESSALVAWADTRNTRADLPSSDLVAQDIYSARATLLFGAARPAGAKVAGALLLLGGGAAVWVGRRRLRRT